MAEKLDEFFASVLTVENIGHVPMLQLLFSGKASEKLWQTEVTRDQ